MHAHGTMLRRNRRAGVERTRANGSVLDVVVEGEVGVTLV